MLAAEHGPLAKLAHATTSLSPLLSRLPSAGALTFVSSAFVPIESMPEVLQWFASYNPISALAAAVRELFGNPTTPVTKDAWPLEHPVAASWLYCTVLLALAVPAALHRFRARTSD